MRASDEQFLAARACSGSEDLAVLLLGFSNRKSEVFYDVISEKAPQQLLPGPRNCCGFAAQAATMVVDPLWMISSWQHHSDTEKQLVCSYFLFAYLLAETNRTCGCLDQCFE